MDLPLGFRAAPLGSVDLAAHAGSAWRRFAHEKRWVYVTVSAGDLLFGAAVVFPGYASNAFAYALDRKARRMLADRSAMGTPFCAGVAPRTEEGCEAHFRCGRSRARIARPPGESAYTVDLAFPGLELTARGESAGAPPPLSAIVELPGGWLTTTQKRALLPVTGRADVEGRRVSLDGGWMGIDYSRGLLPRHTAWNWAFGQGRAATGERVAFNVVEGFIGAPECGLWVEDRLVQLPEARFRYDRKRLEAPWSVRTPDGSLELEFTPAGLHREEKNLWLVVSHFAQALGAFHGTVRLPDGPTLEIRDLPGMTEDQDVTW